MRFKNALVVSFGIILCFASCRNSIKQESKKLETSNIEDNRLITNNRAETDTCSQNEANKILTDLSTENTEYIDFFGERLSGTYEDIINRLYKVPALRPIELRDSIKISHKNILYFSHTVDFCGVPCGMNVRFTKDENAIMHIHELTFITSRTDEDIIQKFVTEISKHYGVPEIPEHARYNWFTHNQRICARHLHAPEGGWTVYFCL